MNTELNGQNVTKEEVVALLRKHNVDFSRWGHPPSYTLDDLLLRLRTEQVFLVEEGNSVTLLMMAGNMLPYINDDETGACYELYEVKQVHGNGVVVERHHLRGVTGILQLNETAFDGAKRELIEELGQTEPRLRNQLIPIIHWHDGTLTRTGPSRKWPGLDCMTISDGFKFRMPAHLYHREYVEVTIDPVIQRTLRTSYFGWRSCYQQTLRTSYFGWRPC